MDSTRTRILVVDDDADQLDTIGDLLRSAGFEADLVQTGRDLRRAMARRRYALLMLDLHLATEDGMCIARELRAHSSLPIIMISGAADPMDRILMLELAADDFLTKPFMPREMLARVRALLRRSHLAQQHRTAGAADRDASDPASVPPSATVTGAVARFGQWQLRFEERELIDHDGRRCELTNQEFRLLEVLVRHPHRVWTREQLIEQTRSLDTDVFDRTIDVLILRLRRKIEPNPKLPQYICTERGQGYVFSAAVRSD
jgi:two-component system OmpR family response regulator